MTHDDFAEASEPKRYAPQSVGRTRTDQIAAWLRMGEPPHRYRRQAWARSDIGAAGLVWAQGLIRPGGCERGLLRVVPCSLYRDAMPGDLRTNPSEPDPVSSVALKPSTVRLVALCAYAYFASRESGSASTWIRSLPGV